jgi:hypothetical protein
MGRKTYLGGSSLIRPGSDLLGYGPQPDVDPGVTTLMETLTKDGPEAFRKALNKEHRKAAGRKIKK